MTPEEISGHIEGLRSRAAEVERGLSEPSVYSNQNKCRSLSRELRKLKNLFENFDRWTKALSELEDNRAMLADESDEEFQALINADIQKLESESESLEKQIMASLIPPDPNDDKNIIVEMKPAAGGDEAALFVGDLYRAYSHYAESNGWKKEVLDLTDSALGGIKDLVFSLSGDDVFSKMKYESGVHRVQRIPTTESGGRIHTSTITVSVLPEAEAVEIEVNSEDLRIDVYRASGPGGQCVNTTDSAVRITHVPTGTVVTSQQEKSQHRNKDIAMRILRARLLEVKQREEADKQAASKRAQVGTGDRSERIRTYNFPQNRVTDHRFNVTVHNLPKLLEGDLDTLFTEIIAIECERKLAELGNE
ncbi:MAG: peptide chain release factor 1 [Kiritimatiellaeota bacterium]|nr:peptide chain release factor 1 [Kiritimatiellota bacterium]